METYSRSLGARCYSDVESKQQHCVHYKNIVHLRPSFTERLDTIWRLPGHIFQVWTAPSKLGAYPFQED